MAGYVVPASIAPLPKKSRLEMFFKTDFYKSVQIDDIKIGFNLFF